MDQLIYVPPPPVYKDKSSVSNISHSIQMYDDTPPPLSYGIILSFQLFYILTFTLFLSMFPIYSIGPFDLFYPLLLLQAIVILTFLSVYYRLDRYLLIGYLGEMVCWTLAVIYMCCVFISQIQHHLPVEQDMLHLMVVSLMGAYRAFLAHKLYGWIQKCNEEVVLMTHSRGEEAERGSF